MSGKRVLSTPKHYAYLKISEGCDNCCTYCAIPLIRGRFRSRTIENVVEEAKGLAAGGVKELIVIAQDTTQFGEDLYGKPVLVELLRELCKIDGIHWIRLLYCYPNRISDELLDIMAAEDKIFKYMDLPLQHCSGKVLADMNRYGDAKSLTALIAKMRQKVPGLVLRTTFIAGFQGKPKKILKKWQSSSGTSVLTGWVVLLIPRRRILPRLRLKDESQKRRNNAG